MAAPLLLYDSGMEEKGEQGGLCSSRTNDQNNKAAFIDR